MRPTQWVCDGVRKGHGAGGIPRGQMQGGRGQPAEQLGLPRGSRRRQQQKCSDTAPWQPDGGESHQGDWDHVGGISKEGEIISEPRGSPPRAQRGGRMLGSEPLPALLGWAES